MDYIVSTKNKFCLFLDDGDEDVDPMEILAMRLEKEAEAHKKDSKSKDTKSSKDSKSAVKAKKTGKSAPSSQDSKAKPDNRDTRKEEKPLRNKSRNDDRPNRPRENRERDLPPRRQNQENRGFGYGGPAQGDNESRYDGNRGRGERRGRGRGGPRGGQRGASNGFDRFGKRGYDRHSGSDKTGIKATDKREGGGAHNWGTVKDDIEEVTTLPEQTTDAPAKTEDVENQQPNAEQEIAEDAPQEEQGPTEMTLDEFRKQENRKKTENAFNVRQAGEGCDNSQWKKTFVLKKKVEESDEEEEEDEEEEDYRPKKQTVNIEITFGDQSRRGGGNRGRGGRFRGGMDRGGRGRGGRGGPRGGQGGQRQAQAPNVEDELDFPSLGK